ncbi:hypothetical protein BDZ97DRAFT_383282 [Flammula alnicola]|nr:hypothetical protein BDZ97DRAFT_383282 [Flammula alnicola]
MPVRAYSSCRCLPAASLDGQDFYLQIDLLYAAPLPSMDWIFTLAGFYFADLLWISVSTPSADSFLFSFGHRRREFYPLNSPTSRFSARFILFPILTLLDADCLPYRLKLACRSSQQHGPWECSWVHRFARGSVLEYWEVVRACAMHQSTCVGIQSHDFHC